MAWVVRVLETVTQWSGLSEVKVRLGVVVAKLMRRLLLPAVPWPPLVMSL